MARGRGPCTPPNSGLGSWWHGTLRKTPGGSGGSGVLRSIPGRSREPLVGGAGRRADVGSPASGCPQAGGGGPTRKQHPKGQVSPGGVRLLVGHGQLRCRGLSVAGQATQEQGVLWSRGSAPPPPWTPVREPRPCCFHRKGGSWKIRPLVDRQKDKAQSWGAPDLELPSPAGPGRPCTLLAVPDMSK